MMRKTFESARWGTVTIQEERYNGADDGPLAILLVQDGERLATLSVNMYKPECSHDSRDLPAHCFYVKDWSENVELASDAMESGLFKRRMDLPAARSGHCVADVWELL